MAEDMSSRQYKIILIGDPGVGKTSYFIRIRDAEFVDTDQRSTVTVGVECLEYPMKIDGRDVLVS